MTFLASYFLAGVLGLLVLDYTDQLSLAAMAAAVRTAFRPTPYVGRHRADEQSTMQAVDEKRAARAALREPTQSLFLPPEDKAPLCPPMYPYRAGSPHYVALKPRVLDAKVHVDLTAWRLRTSTMPRVEEHDDEWAVA